LPLNLKEKKHFGYLGWDSNIKLDLKKYDVRLWTGFIRFRVGSSDGLL
jgi:hypothetical protein